MWTRLKRRSRCWKTQFMGSKDPNIKHLHTRHNPQKGFPGSPSDAAINLATHVSQSYDRALWSRCWTEFTVRVVRSESRLIVIASIFRVRNADCWINTAIMDDGMSCRRANGLSVNSRHMFFTTCSMWNAIHNSFNMRCLWMKLDIHWENDLI